MLYVGLKILHLVSVILWIGPPLGAYYFLFRAHQSKDPDRILWSEALAERVLFMEHVALAVLVASGVAFLYLSEWSLLAVPWIQKKLMLFGGVALFEAYDIWFAHAAVRKLLIEEVPLDDERWTAIDRYRRILIILAVPVGLILIPGMLYFAIAKQ